MNEFPMWPDEPVASLGIDRDTLMEILLDFVVMHHDSARLQREIEAAATTKGLK